MTPHRRALALTLGASLAGPAVAALAGDPWQHGVGFALAALAVCLTVALAALHALVEWHHGYLGLLAVVAGLVQAAPALCALGLVILADDVYQHLRQAFGELQYRSPLHRLAHRLGLI